MAASNAIVTPAMPVGPDTAGPDRADRLRARMRLIGVATVALALVCVTLTFLVLTGLTPIPPTRDVTIIALIPNGIIVAVLVALTGFEVYTLWHARTARRAGARLHVRIVALFSIIAVLPAVLVAAVATITLSRGLDRWFEERTIAIVDSSIAVADAYVAEHAGLLRSDLVAMANDLDRARQMYDLEPTRFEDFLQAQTTIRGLPASYLMKSDGTVMVNAVVNPKLKLRMPPANALKDAVKGQPVMIAPGAADQVGAILKLKNYDDLYLYIARPMDPRVIDYVRLTANNAQEYHNLAANRTNVQVAFGLVYAGVCLVLLLSAIWLGFGFANRLVAPIRRLIGATDSLSRGNLWAEVPVNPDDGDLAHLGITFNKMTAQLRSQREDLLAANEQIDKRRRFTEAVLSGVTAGVLGISAEGRISLANRSAVRLLGIEENELVGKPVTEALPDIAPMIGEGGRALGFLRAREQQVTVRSGQEERTVIVRVTTDRTDRRRPGYVVTLDDITDLVVAQRSSAWADVARRIAHEIKNPLTPIQLSAERIKRRYGKRIADEDREVFDQCIDTIVRQVGDIGRMVNEFSQFARMPKPVMERHDIREAVREAVFLQGTGRTDLRTATKLPSEPMVAVFDPRLITQAVANLVKNAAEAIEQTTAADRGGEPGRIDVVVRAGDEGAIVIEIVDNGIGLPHEERHKLLEPYVTTREKGTGLGLAIVQKIAEEHGGRVELLDATAVGDYRRGACVRFILPATEPLPETTEPQPLAAPSSASEG